MSAEQQEKNFVHAVFGREVHVKELSTLKFLPGKI
jgi:hypothetical protein